MKTKKILVNSMFKNILTAGTVAFAMIFGFTACSDELANESSERQSDEIPAGADTRLLEAYGLMYNDFESDNDVQILNADTTIISVNKAYADKMGITNFVNHPMGIWQNFEELAYLRRATAQHEQQRQGQNRYNPLYALHDACPPHR